MFDQLEMAPPDAILGLTEAFNKDPRPNKINLSVGVYKDEAGKTPVLTAVKQAERKILESESTKGYKPIDGAPDYNAAVQMLMLGDHPLIAQGRVQTAHTPGGTGGLRVAADYLHRMNPGVTVHLSDPTWPNHPSIFQSAGVETKTYRYFDPKTNALDLEGMLSALRQIPAGDVVLLHGCCHNPSGVDPTPQHWRRMAAILAEHNLVPLVDFAYQGFGDGLEEDAVGVRAILEAVDEAFICSSFSKNFGLYCERTGALSVIARTADAAAKAMSHMKTCIRTNYSNPPAHGGEIVSTILGDPRLTALWHDEVTMMRTRINGMRTLFADTLDAKGITLPGGDNRFIVRQRGMFSFSGLNKDQVATLRDKYAVYIVGSGRINVAGMTESNMDALCEAIGKVV